MTITLDRRWATPGAELVLGVDAPRAEWLAARRQGLGGSDASTVVGLNPYGSWMELWLDKTGRAPAEIDNDAMEWGRRLEPAIREWFTDHTGIDVRRCGLLRSIEHPIMLLSPDGITVDGGLLEIKTSTWRQAHEWDDDQVPDHAELQVQHAMAVAGREHAWVAALIDGRKPLLRRVNRDDALIAYLVALEHDFWDGYVVTDEAPPLDGSQATNDAVKAWFPVEDAGKAIELTAELLDLFEARAAYRRAGAEADAGEREVDSRIRALIGDAELVVDDLSAEQPTPLVTLRANGTFSEKKLRAEEPEVAAQFTTLRKTVLDAAALKAARPDLHTRCRARVLRTTKALDALIGGK